PARLTLTINVNFSYVHPDLHTFPTRRSSDLNDGQADSGIATVSITITGVNDAPVAVNDSYTTAEDTTLNVAAPGVLINDSDVDDVSIRHVRARHTTHGSLTSNTNGSISYVAA